MKNQIFPTIFDWVKKAYGKNKDEVFNLMKKFYSSVETKYDGEYNLITKDNRILTWNFNSSHIGELPDGRSVIMSVGRDVTEFNKANKKLKERERQYRLLTEMMPLGIVHYEIIDDPYEKKIDFKVLGVNKVFEQLVGKNNSELINKNIWEIFPKTEKYWIDFFEKIALTGKTNILENYAISIDSYIKVTAYKIESDKIAVIMEDISEDRRKQKEIMYMSYHDSLTGLYNRRY